MLRGAVEKGRSGEDCKLVGEDGTEKSSPPLACRS